MTYNVFGGMLRLALSICLWLGRKILAAVHQADCAKMGISWV